MCWHIYYVTIYIYIYIYIEKNIVFISHARILDFDLGSMIIKFWYNDNFKSYINLNFLRMCGGNFSKENFYFFYLAAVLLSQILLA
jgi:hypothetical protein